MEKNKKKIIIVGILLTLLVMIGTSYAWWTYTATQVSTNKINSDCLKITLSDETGAITLDNAFPITDSDAEKLEPYTFKITNSCTTGVNYNINLALLKEENQQDSEILSNEFIAIKFNDGEKQLLSDLKTVENATYKNITGENYSLREKKQLTTGYLSGGVSETYTLKLWMDEDVTIENDAMDKKFIAKIEVEASLSKLAHYTETLLNGADPVLDEDGELVAVKIDAEGNVEKADITQEWYNYGNKEWANAVILTEDGKGKNYKNGETIEEDDIESYFVWIPKYSYKLFDLGKYTAAGTAGNKNNQAVDIRFGLKNTDDSIQGECTTPMDKYKEQGLSGESWNCSVNDYMTHPAFISFGVNGFWVGKFETSKTISSTIQIKPNQTSWNNIKIGESFTKSKEYKEDLLSHMIKNTEWGAVAYLTQSIYGMCSNEGSGTSCSEVAQNKNASYTTGYESTDKAYPGSRNASTTGNNTGIFDMNGGLWEQMASVMESATGNKTPLWGQSGLSSIEDKRYYDIYNYGTNTQYWNRRILGDATGELGPFQLNNNSYVSSYFGDWSNFVNTTDPWHYRGNYSLESTNLSGIFASDPDPGVEKIYTGFRVVLAPQ